MAIAQETQLSPQSEEGNLNFCVTFTKDATQSKLSKYLEDFSPLVEQASVAWVDANVENFNKEAVEAATKFGFSDRLVRRLLRNLTGHTSMRGGYEDFDTEIGLLIPAIQVKVSDVMLEPLLILMKKNLILTVHSRNATPLFRMRRYAQAFLGRLPQNLKQNDWLTLVLIRIIDTNNQDNFMQMQEIEEGVDNVSRDLSTTKFLPAELSTTIYQMKHTLVRYILGLWATVDVLSSLRNGDACLLSDNPRVLNRIDRLTSEVHTQIGIAEHISETLASGLECLQSLYNNRLQILNNRLSIVNIRLSVLVGWLAVIGTAIAVPNTVATVFGQTTVFQLTPKDMGWYLLLIVGSTVIATFFAWLWVKKMGLMPKKGEEAESSPIPAGEKERDEP